MALTQPKKPVGGAYGIFLAKHRPEFMAAAKGQKASVVSQMAGERWKSLSEDERKPYQKEFEVVKAKYEEDMKAFLAAGGEKALGTRALATKKRKEREEGGKGKRAKVNDPNKPKKPAGGAFGVFLNKNRKEFQKQAPGSVAVVSKLASAKWKELSAAEKKPYEEEFLKLQSAYKEAMKTYKPPSGSAEVADDEDGDEEDDEEAEEAEDQ
mmetsp:Transcript_49726/g.138193  ORF Transcript_49726/g.138193 Transcript_49726/m.138193 type:complete len:210 (-) Transcript_49726:350-979(-)